LLHVKGNFEMNVTFPVFLSQLLTAKGWKPADLARATGLSHVAILNYLKGRTPKYEQAQKIAAAFGITPDYLLNPDVYSAGIRAAAAIADSMEGTEEERTARFNSLVMEDAVKLKARSERWENAESLMEPSPVYGEDWKGRALRAEDQLASLKSLLLTTSENIKLPMP
jgi:transcriptional regulator with XRE-family HTH domain